MTTLDKALNKARSTFASFDTNRGTFAGRVSSVGNTFVTLNIPYLDKPVMRVKMENIKAIRCGSVRYNRK